MSGENNNHNEEPLEINDTNFLKVVEEKLAYIKKSYLDKENKIDELNKNISDKEEKEKIDKNKNTNKENTKLKNKKITRRFKILKECLMILKYNGITIKEFMKNNPFHSKPFQLNNSFEFIDAVKYEKIKEMETFLKANANLLYSFDYYRQTGFHWAAKKNHIKAAKLMIKYGNCVNQIDINHMTPLAICAKNNNFEMCQLLCENGANPFIPNNEGKIPIDLADDIKLKTYLLNWGDNFYKLQNH
jgi:ankyrin repeat protein